VPVNIVDKEEQYPLPGSSERSFGTDFPASPEIDGPGGVDPWGDRIIEGDLGQTLNTLTDEPAPSTGMSTYDDWSDSYSSENQFEDDNLKLGQRTQRQPWVAVDLDGTILEEPTDEDYAAMDERAQQTGEQLQPAFGAPIEGAQEVLAELMSLGWRVSIYTARFADLTDPDTVAIYKQQIEEHLHRHGIEFSDIWTGSKPRADYFVDNKNVVFRGDWNQVLVELTTYDPVEEQDISRDDEALEDTLNAPSTMTLEPEALEAFQ
jgi:hypothetical protein